MQGETQQGQKLAHLNEFKRAIDAINVLRLAFATWLWSSLWKQFNTVMGSTFSTNVYLIVAHFVTILSCSRMLTQPPMTLYMLNHEHLGHPRQCVPCSSNHFEAM